MTGRTVASSVTDRLWPVLLAVEPPSPFRAARSSGAAPHVRRRSPQILARSSGIGLPAAPYARLVGLVERDTELAALQSQWARARAGSGGFVLVTAESGGGKTALVNEFARSLMAQAPVLWGACDPLRRLGRSVRCSTCGTSSACEARTLLEGAGQAHQIYLAVHDDLRAHPRILVVEDLHWADQGTVDLLRFLLRRIGTTNAMVVGTLRPDEIAATHPLRSLLGDAARSPERGDTRSPTAQWRQRSARWSTTGPSTPTGCTHSPAAIPSSSTRCSTTTATTLPRTVRDAILARTVGPRTCRTRPARPAGVCAGGDPRPPAPAARHRGLRPLRSLHEAGLIRRSQRGVAFHHDLCRLAIAGSLPPGGEAALHRRMLEALETGGTDDAAVLVHHARGADDWARVLRYATAAGIAAVRSGAHAQAADFFALALEHGEQEAAESRPICWSGSLPSSTSSTGWTRRSAPSRRR